MIYDFVPEQDLNGYSRPWPAGGGKNLFDYSLFETVAESLTYVSFDIANGTYTMSTDFPAVDGVANVFILAGAVEAGASSETNGVTATTPRMITVSDGKYTVAYRSTSETNPNNPVNYKWQLESGSSATVWTPYKNICPITGVYVPGIGTVYAGSIDTVSRELTITHGIGDLGEPTWNIDSGNNTFYCNLFAGQKGTNSTDVANAYCTAFKLASNASVSANTEDGTIAAASGYNRVYYAKMVGATAAEFKTALTGFKFVFELSTPVKVTLTEQQITALLGELGVARNFNSAEIMVNVWLYMAQGRDPSDLTRQVLRPISKPVIDKPISFDDKVKELPADDVISPDEEPEENITEEKEEEDNASE